MLTRLAGTAVITAATAVMVACGSSGSGDGGTTSPKGQITIALDQSSATVAAGASVVFTVRVTGSNGFSGPASVTVTGAPNGVTTTVSASQLAGAVTSTTVTVASSASVTPGVYALTVSASGSGVSSVTASFALTVSAPVQTGGFSVALSPGALSLTQGSNAATTITITRTGGFTGAVGLAASGMSSGMVATFNPSNASGTTATLTVAATSVASTGTVTLGITGSAAGLPNQTTSVQVTVTPAATGGSGDVIVDFTNCQPSGKPIWFARQDGAAAWSQVTSTSDVYRFSVSSAGGGYAYATSADAGHSAVTVTLLSRSELTTAPIIVCPTRFGSKTVTATVKAVGPSEDSFVSLGGSTVEATRDDSISIPNVPNGTFDLVGWRFNSARGINTASDSRAVIIRDVDAAAGQSAGTVDFAAANVILPVVWSVNFEGAASGDMFTGSMSYYTGPRESCSAALLYDFSNTSASLPGTYGFPGSAQRASDYHVLNVVATNPPNTRITQQSFHTAASVAALRLHETIPAPTVTDLGAVGYKRLQAIGSTPAIYSSAATFSYTDAFGARAASIQESIAALGGNAASLTIPDFSGVAGWNPAWMPATATVNWTFGGSGATYSGLPCLEGALYYAAYYSGSM